MIIKNTLNIIWKHSKSYKLPFVNLFICILVTSFIGMVYPYIFAIMVDEIYYHKNLDFFIVVVLAYAILFFGGQILHLILNATWAYLMTKYLFDIRKKIFEKVHDFKATFLDRVNTGDLITIINNDTTEFMNFIHWNIFYLVANIIRFITAIIFIFIINYQIAFLLLFAIPLIIFTTRLFGGKAKVININYRKKYGKYISWIFEIINGMREIRLLSGENQIKRKFIGSWRELIHLNIRSSIVSLISERTNSLITLLVDISLYVLAGILIIRGELTLGGFVAIIEYFIIGKILFKNLNEANIRIQKNMVSIEKVINILSEKTESKKGNELYVRKGDIEFNNVSFSYKDRKVLKNFSLKINSGEKITIVGSSGSGKSTAMNLLLKFYNCKNGQILIDNQNINNLTIESIRKNIGIVRQEPLIFNNSIEYNLKLGKADAAEDELWEALEKAHADKFISCLSDKLKTMIGNNGTGLSGGQIQRLTIARIFLKNPKILIFDEATSSLDAESEKSVHKAWEELFIDRTSIVIAHRLSTIAKSKKIAFLSNGRILGIGNHKELLIKHSEYRNMFKLQYIDESEFII